MVLVVVAALGCVSQSGSDAGEPAQGDTGSGETGDPGGETGESGVDSSDSGERVLVRLGVWTPETACWEVVYEWLDARYWWGYDENGTSECNDIAWHMAGGERCIGLHWLCQGDPQSDPEFASTPEQVAICAEVEAQTAQGKVPGCP